MYIGLVTFIGGMCLYIHVYLYGNNTQEGGKANRALWD